LAEANIEDYCDMPASIFSPNADYFLRVKGDSMINVGIFDNDLLAVHRCSEARNGQIVVARIDNEVTVKRFQQQKKQISRFADCRKPKLRTYSS
jgi:repressor LexA